MYGPKWTAMAKRTVRFVPYVNKQTLVNKQDRYHVVAEVFADDDLVAWAVMVAQNDILRASEHRNLQNRISKMVYKDF